MQQTGGEGVKSFADDLTVLFNDLSKVGEAELKKHVIIKDSETGKYRLRTKEEANKLPIGRETHPDHILTVATQLSNAVRQATSSPINYKVMAQKLHVILKHATDIPNLQVEQTALRLEKVQHECLAKETLDKLVSLSSENVSRLAPQIAESLKTLIQFQEKAGSPHFNELLNNIILCLKTKVSQEKTLSADLGRHFAKTISSEFQKLILTMAQFTDKPLEHHASYQKALLDAGKKHPQLKDAFKDLQKLMDQEISKAVKADITATGNRIRTKAQPERSSTTEIKINNHSYVAYGPKTALQWDVFKVPDFVRNAAKSPLVVNLMGKWEMGQLGRHYVPPPANSERTTRIENYRTGIKELVAIVDPKLSLSLAKSLSKEELKSLNDTMQKHSLTPQDEEKITALAKRSIDAGYCTDALLKLKDKELFNALLATLNTHLQNVLEEDANFEAFRETYAEPREVSNDIRIAAKKSDSKQLLLEVDFNERVEKDRLKANLLRLLSSADYASDVAATLGNKPTYIHCDKAFIRTSMFLVLFELMRNKKELVTKTDSQIMVFMQNVANQFNETDPERNLPREAVEILFSPEFIQEFRRVASAHKK